MTERSRRRAPAAAARRLVGGASVAAVFALVAGWTVRADTVAVAPPAPPPDVRVVITDPAIDPDVAVAAALDAAARDLDRVAVPVARPAAVSTPTQQVSHDAHSITRAS